jgi:hypothetical protein
MDIAVKIMTHESIVHTQILSIEKLLNRNITYDVTLNTRGVKSYLSFLATPEEVELVKADLGYRILW